MYPNYYAEKEKRNKDKMMELFVTKKCFIDVLNHEIW